MVVAAFLKCVVSKTIYLCWSKEINKEKGQYGIQETEDAMQDRDEGMVERNSRATSVQQTGEPPVQTGATGQRNLGELPPGGQTYSNNNDEFPHTLGHVENCTFRKRAV